MPRSGKVKKTIIKPDPVYQDKTISKLINKIMVSGKKSIAQNHVYTAFEQVKRKTKSEPLEVFSQALDNIKPKMEVRSRRVGGAAYQVPYPVRGKRQILLAIKWLIEATRARSNKTHHTFADKLAAEIVEASQNEGGAIKRKVETHRMAEANKAFAHFRW